MVILSYETCVFECIKVILFWLQVLTLRKTLFCARCRLEESCLSTTRFLTEGLCYIVGLQFLCIYDSFMDFLADFAYF